MFKGKHRGSLKKAVDRAADPEIHTLKVEIADRKDAIAELELELSDMRNDLSRFEIEHENRVGHLRKQLEEAEEQLKDARRRDSYRKQWGDDPDPEEIPDVMEQFNRTWSPKEEPPPPPPPEEPPDEVTKEELKALFRKLAKLYHPDLTTDPYTKKRSVGVMTKINKAYAAGDVATLQSLMQPPSPPEPPRRQSRGEIITELRNELVRLDRVVRDLQNDLNQLVNSETVRLMLDVSIAQRQGRDLLNELAEELTMKIERVEAEYRSLR
jgi:hypothetical protein